MNKYQLYYTLNKDIESRKLTDKEIDGLISFFNSKKFTQDKKKAVILLCIEHSIAVDEYEYDSDNMQLPYDIIEEDDAVVIDFEKLPDKLKWILYKFYLLNRSNQSESS